jgi:subtilisin family serine protease
LPVKQQIVAALTPYIAAHNVEKQDIWAARDVTLTPSDKLTPVRIAVWDGGVDTSIFPSQVFNDTSPSTPGHEHGPHGLAFDTQGNPYAGDLQPTTPEQKAFYPRALALEQGINDLSSNISSAAADSVRKFVSSTPPDQMALYLKQLNFIGQWMHGTHVAGIASRGNPAARLVVVAFYDSLPELPFAPTVEWANKFKADFLRVGEYFRDNNVRVVNMSWADSQSEIEQWLSKTSTEKDPTVRKQFAAQIYGIWRDAVEGAIKAAPNTLFICAAGNSDSNAGFLGDVPASLKLPNLITVGAVDQAGEETSFTSYGDTVVLDADGFQVESYVPGGTRLKLSGTSMASPNVANLAGKLIAIDPSLTPEQTIALMEKGADASANGRLHVINPKATMALLEARMKEKGAGD